MLIPRGDYFQCGYVVKKGGAEELQAKGLDAFKRSIEDAAPALRGRCDVLKSWDDVKLLTVAVDRLKTWCAPGVLCIGDAAHAMSPIGGVGINLAVQDAVATANLLWSPLKAGAVTLADLQAVQRRREWPTKVTQGGAGVHPEPRHRADPGRLDAQGPVAGEAGRPRPVPAGPDRPRARPRRALREGALAGRLDAAPRA